MTEQTQQITLSPSAKALRHALESSRNQFEAALPPHVTPDKFLRVALTAVQNDPMLEQAEHKSLLGAFMKCAQDGLLPNGREAAITCFKNNKAGTVEATYMPMIGGILKMMRQSGEILSVSANVVHENDDFTYQLGDNERIVHRPAFSDRGPMIAAYAVIKTKDGGIYREVMGRDEIMAVKGVSKATSRGPWAGPFESEMWKKTVIRRAAKRAPTSTDVEQVLANDDANYDFKREERDVTPPLKQVGPSRLKAALAAPEPVVDPETGEIVPDNLGVTNNE